MEQNRERETSFEEVIVEIRDKNVEVTKVPAGVTVFVCDHDEAEELESMGEAYALRTVRGPLDRSTLGPKLLREKIEERLADVEAAGEAMRALLDALTIEDAEELAVAVGSLTDAQSEIREAMDEILPDERPGEDPGKRPLPQGGYPDLPAPGAALDAEPGLMTLADLRDLVARMANNRHVRYWIGHNHGPSDLYPPEGEPSLMAFELLDVTEDGTPGGSVTGGPLRARPAEIYERDIRERGFAKEVRGSSVYWVVRRAEEDGTPWRPRFRP